MESIDKHFDVLDMFFYVNDELNLKNNIHSKTGKKLLECLEKGDFKNKNVLVKVGSGDPYLTILSRGGTNIDTYDENINSYYYLILKIVAILNLSVHDYKEMFIEGKMISSSFFLKEYMNCDIYFSFRKFLPIEIRIYWDYIFNHIDDIGKIFEEKPGVFTFSNPQYVKKDNYIKLRDSLNEKGFPKYFNSDLKSTLTKSTSKYDLIVEDGAKPLVYKLY